MYKYLETKDKKTSSASKVNDDSDIDVESGDDSEEAFAENAIKEEMKRL
jgi:hypothetical protein